MVVSTAVLHAAESLGKPPKSLYDFGLSQEKYDNFETIVLISLVVVQK